MNVVIVERTEVDTAGVVRLADTRAVHLRSVLKVTAGQAVRIGLLDGAMGAGTVVDVGHDAVTLRCDFSGPVPPAARVDLLLALPRPKVMRRLWAQLAALGVARIVLTNAERVERNYFDTHVLEPDDYRPLLIEGLQQARDTRLPVVSIHRRFKVLVEDELDSISGDSVRLVADPGGGSGVSEAAAGAGAGRVLLAVGPEGGWNAFELALLERHRFQRVRMGPRTLRTDTACIALLSLVHDALEPER